MLINLDAIELIATVAICIILIKFVIICTNPYASSPRLATIYGDKKKLIPKLTKKDITDVAKFKNNLFLLILIAPVILYMRHLKWLYM